MTVSDIVTARPKSAPSKRSARLLAITWHRTLAVIGGLALLLWGGSGLLHPLMSAIGPQQAVFFPPGLPPGQSLDLQGIKPVHQTLAEAGIAEATAVKVVMSKGGPLLQVTGDPDAPRRYFDLMTGAERPDHDRAHAVFLARHYLREDAPIRAVEKLTDFTPDYPWVNRLLPVYHVQFERPDNLSIYIYTETNAAAGVNNTTKTILQTGFRWFHTWSWFPHQAEWGRVILITLFVGSLFALAATGLAMLLLIRRKRRAPGSRGWHRIAGYALALPLLMFTSSGIFHLIEFSLFEPGKTLRLAEPMDLRTAQFPIHEQWPMITAGLTVSTLSIVQAPADGRYLYRLGLARSRDAAAPVTAAEIRNARFDGVPRTGPARYLDAESGAVWPDGDRELAIQLAENFTGVSREAITDAALITRFGAGYDFRNKRLPVWRLSYGAPLDADYFVDTTTGVLADIAPHRTKPERFSFSMLHKWNFLRPLGRDMQNIIVSGTVILAIGLMGVLGLRLDIKRRKRR